MSRVADEVSAQLARVGFPRWSVGEAANGRVLLSDGPRQVTCDPGALIEGLQKLPDDLGGMNQYDDGSGLDPRPDAVLWRAVSQAARQ